MMQKVKVVKMGIKEPPTCELQEYSVSTWQRINSLVVS